MVETSILSGTKSLHFLRERSLIYMDLKKAGAFAGKNICVDHLKE